MSGDLDLEQRYRRVLRLLPRYYRDKWEEDMVAAFLDGWLTGDPDEDSVTMEYDRPTREEIVSVIGLAARLYLGGVGAPRRYFAWGQAVRNAVLGVMLAHAVWGLGQLALFARSRHLIGWLPPPPGGFWPMLVVRDRLRLDRGLRRAGRWRITGPPGSSRSWSSARPSPAWSISSWRAPWCRRSRRGRTRS